jgi:hypothetical protein
MWNLKSSNELCSQRRTAEVKKKKREKKKIYCPAKRNSILKSTFNSIKK